MAANAPKRPWYAGRSLPAYFFKVNRRPLAQLSLLSDGPPPDSFAHFAATIPYGEGIESVRGLKRVWILGQSDDGDPDQRILVGEIGWQRPEQRLTSRFDDERRAWVDEVEDSNAYAHAPFVYDGETQRLVVLGHPSFSPGAIAWAFTELLNRSEQRLEDPTVEWDVAPMLDAVTFREWLHRTEAVQKVIFTARLPNPDGLAPFQPMLDRLEEREAASLTETWTARDPERGLANIEDDPDAKQMIAMAENGYANVSAKGRGKDGLSTSYSQRDRAKTEMTPDLPDSFGAMMGLVIDWSLKKARSRLP